MASDFAHRITFLTLDHERALKDISMASPLIKKDDGQAHHYLARCRRASSFLALMARQGQPLPNEATAEQLAGAITSLLDALEDLPVRCKDNTDGAALAQQLTLLNCLARALPLLVAAMADSKLRAPLGRAQLTQWRDRMMKTRPRQAAWARRVRGAEALIELHLTQVDLGLRGALGAASSSGSSSSGSDGKAGGGGGGWFGGGFGELLGVGAKVVRSAAVGDVSGVLAGVGAGASMALDACDAQQAAQAYAPLLRMPGGSELEPLKPADVPSRASPLRPSSPSVCPAPLRRLRRWSMPPHAAPSCSQQAATSRRHLCHPASPCPPSPRYHIVATGADAEALRLEAEAAGGVRREGLPPALSALLQAAAAPGEHLRWEHRAACVVRATDVLLLDRVGQLGEHDDYDHLSAPAPTSKPAPRHATPAPRRSPFGCGAWAA